MLVILTYELRNWHFICVVALLLAYWNAMLLFSRVILCINLLLFATQVYLLSTSIAKFTEYVVYRQFAIPSEVYVNGLEYSFIILDTIVLTTYSGTVIEQWSGAVALRIVFTVFVDRLHAQMKAWETSGTLEHSLALIGSISLCLCALLQWSFFIVTSNAFENNDANSLLNHIFIIDSISVIVNCIFLIFTAAMHMFGYYVCVKLFSWAFNANWHSLEDTIIDPASDEFYLCISYAHTITIVIASWIYMPRHLPIAVQIAILVRLFNYSRAHQAYTKYKNILNRFPEVVAPSSQTCGICLEDFNESETVTQLPCKHIFHSRCVRKWLTRNLVCPICRHPAEHAVTTPELNINHNDSHNTLYNRNDDDNYDYYYDDDHDVNDIENNNNNNIFNNASTHHQVSEINNNINNSNISIITQSTIIRRHSESEESSSECEREESNWHFHEEIESNRKAEVANNGSDKREELDKTCESQVQKASVIHTRNNYSVYNMKEQCTTNHVSSYNDIEKQGIKVENCTLGNEYKNDNDNLANYTTENSLFSFNNNSNTSVENVQSFLKSTGFERNEQLCEKAIDNYSPTLSTYQDNREREISKNVSSCTLINQFEEKLERVERELEYIASERLREKSQTKVSIDENKNSVNCVKCKNSSSCLCDNLTECTCNKVEFSNDYLEAKQSIIQALDESKTTSNIFIDTPFILNNKKKNKNVKEKRMRTSSLESDLNTDNVKDPTKFQFTSKEIESNISNENVKKKAKRD